MKKYTFNILGFSCLIFLLSQALPIAAQVSCRGSLTPRLVVGQSARVTPGVPNNLRDTPESGAIIGKIAPGDVFEVLSGPVCGTSNNLTWWHVRFNGVEGWTAESDSSEYWVEPIVSQVVSCDTLLASMMPDELLSVMGRCVQDTPDQEVAMQRVALGLMMYFARGGTPETLHAVIHRPYIEDQFADSIIMENTLLSPLPDPRIVVYDLDGDGLDDITIAIAFSIYFQQNLPPGMLIVLRQENAEAYNPIYYESFADIELFSPMGAVEIVALDRLNADASPDLVISSGDCGAHTCWSDLQFFRWDGSAFVSNSAISEQLPYPTVEIIEPGTDNVKVELFGGGIGSVGAGLTPPVKQVWSFDPVPLQWNVKWEDVPSPYRIHAITRGDAATQTGDYAVAANYYKQALFDDTLENDLLWEPEIARAYSYYRLTLLYLLQDQTQEAALLAKDAGRQFAQSEWDVFYRMSVTLLDNYKNDSLAAGCRAVQATIEEDADFPFLAFDWGYANPMYDAAAFCPFTDL